MLSMYWFTTKPKKKESKKIRHLNCEYNYTVCGLNVLDLEEIRYDSSAPKCKNCLKVLKKLTNE